MSEKSSNTINLVILGLLGAYIALPLLPQGDEYRRNTYRSRDECVADYSETDCEPTESGGSSGGGSGGGGRYRGPSYRADPSGHPEDPGPGHYKKTYGGTNPAVSGVESSFRGGFGNLARKFGAGS